MEGGRGRVRRTRCGVRPAGSPGPESTARRARRGGTRRRAGHAAGQAVCTGHAGTPRVHAPRSIARPARPDPSVPSRRPLHARRRRTEDEDEGRPGSAAVDEVGERRAQAADARRLSTGRCRAPPAPATAPDASVRPPAQPDARACGRNRRVVGMLRPRRRDHKQPWRPGRRRVAAGRSARAAQARGTTAATRRQPRSRRSARMRPGNAAARGSRDARAASAPRRARRHARTRRLRPPRPRRAGPLPRRAGRARRRRTVRTSRPGRPAAGAAPPPGRPARRPWHVPTRACASSVASSGPARPAATAPGRPTGRTSAQCGGHRRLALPRAANLVGIAPQGIHPVILRGAARR